MYRREVDVSPVGSVREVMDTVVPSRRHWPMKKPWVARVLMSICEYGRMLTRSYLLLEPGFEEGDDLLRG